MWQAPTANTVTTNARKRWRMPMKLYYHPLSSFCQKVLIALYENDTAFEPVVVDFFNDKSAAAFKALWPVGKFPVLADGDRIVPESSIIIEYLDVVYPGKTAFIPRDTALAREVRLRDRFFDLHVNALMQKIVTDRLRPAGKNDPYGVEDARSRLLTAYAVADEIMSSRKWAAGDAFGMADCAAAPALFFANLVAPFEASHAHVAAYLRRLRDRPSVARVFEEARPYLELVPK
jgi:glutathione S-transferase